MSQYTTLEVVVQLIGDPALLSIFGAEMLFNMKKAAEEGANQGTSCKTDSSMTQMDFAEPTVSSAVTTLEIHELTVVGPAIPEYA